MKKTFITLAALAFASVASAGTIALTGGSSTSSAGLGFDLSSYNIDIKEGWTLQFDAVYDTTTSNEWSNIVTFGKQNAGGFTVEYHNAGNYELQVGYNGSWFDGLGIDRTNSVTGAIPTGETKTYVLTLSPVTETTGGGGTFSLTLTVDGIVYSTMTNSYNANQLSNLAADYLYLGSKGSASQIPMTFSNISLSSPSISDNIPEPTTATLSLLALAGLAARRRRK